MGKKVILILLKTLILSCNLFTNKEEKIKEEKIKEEKPAAKIISVASIQRVEIRASNQNPISIKITINKLIRFKHSLLILALTENMNFNKQRIKSYLHKEK